MNPKSMWPYKYLTEGRTDIDPRRRFLAEGDSWFSLGALKLAKNPNLVSALEFGRDALVVSCASPGDTIEAMATRRKQDPYFDRLIGAKGGEWWAGILVSGGGNDLIDWAQVNPVSAGGAATDPSKRLLLTSEESKGKRGATRYISTQGWDALSASLLSSFRKLDHLKQGGLSRTSPMMAHTYSVPVVRPAGVSHARKGWLFPAMELYAIPVEDRQPLVDELFGRLRSFLLSIDQDSDNAKVRIPGMHVFDSAKVQGLVPADPKSTGESGDWRNEIHLTSGGYQKIGAKMGPWIEKLMRVYG